MTSQQQMGGGQNMGIPPSSAQQNLSFGGAGMTAMTWIQFQKMGYSQQQQQLQPQMVTSLALVVTKDFGLDS